jgi:cobalt/nickel transport system permease protein
MHIPDGLIITNEPLSIFGAIAMWIISLTILYWSWKKAKTNYSHSITAILGISSAFIFAAQMINFPIIFGTSGHLVGGTFLAALLGPYAAILGMTIVLIMQAVIFADGGILSFGINVFTMAIIGGFSFFIIKLINRKSDNKSRLASSIFLASWISVISGALLAGVIISPAFPGGILMTVPSMLIYYAIIGIAEGLITTILVLSKGGFNVIKKIGVIFLILISLAILIPFTSNLPDGLEKVIETLEAEDQNTPWNGLMKDYSIETINNPINSVFISGTIGILIVLITALFLGKTLEIKIIKK